MGAYPEFNLSLFTGIGGGELATQHLLGWRTVAYVERDPYCIDVLKARINDGWLHDAPIWTDVNTFSVTEPLCAPFVHALRSVADALVITAGFPCQPFSAIGKHGAADDDRNGWPATIRIIREIRPRWVFLENTTGLISGAHGYFGTVIGELVESGYSVNWRCLSAAEVGAAHKRDRLWIVADSAGFRREGRDGAGTERWAEPLTRTTPFLSADTWLDISRSGGFGGFDGIPRRMDRFKAIGNGQVPLVVAAAWRLLAGGNENETE